MRSPIFGFENHGPPGSAMRTGDQQKQVSEGKNEIEIQREAEARTRERLWPDFTMVFYSRCF